MPSRNRPSRQDRIDYDSVRPRRSAGEWFRAWRTVVKDPDKLIPDPGIAPEGEPIPEHLDLRCPECGYCLTGLTEWRCPECGERFSPKRAHTLKMLQEPEYFLRYRLDPSDIRRTLWAVVLFVAGIVTAIVATVMAVRSGTVGMLPIQRAWYGLSLLLGLTVIPALALRYVLDIPLPRIAFWLAEIWFLFCTVLLVLVLL